MGPMTGTFEEIIFTDEQKRAIKHEKGHLRIIACPGSGKTEVVSQNVAWLIKNGADPKTIVAFTFTEKAAEELKIRIRSILERECPDRADFGNMFVGTIHSFCFFMLKEIDPAYRSYDVLDDPKRVAFVSKYRNYYSRLKLVRLEKHHGLRHFQTVYKFLESADIVMTENIDPDDLSDRRFAECYETYRELLDEEKYFDFSSIIHNFVEAVQEDKDKLDLLGARVKHVIVDEYQDVNGIQETLIEILSFGADSVCVVGDDDQNIYHWRGSDVRFIRTFTKRYGKKYTVTDVHLDMNFRSTDAIIKTVKSFVEHNTQRLSKNMVHNEQLKRKFESGDIVHRHFRQDSEELAFILSKIRELHGTDFLSKRNKPYSLSYSDFAVLVRTNDDAAKVVGFLDGSDIPCIAYSGTSVFESPIVRLALDCIGYVFNAGSYEDANVVRDLKGLQDEYSRVFNIRQYSEADPTNFGRELGKIKKQADHLFEKKPKDYFGDLGLQGYYHQILSAMGAQDFDFGDVYGYNLAALSTAVSDYESVWVRLRASEVKGFFFFVYTFARGHYTETQHSDTSIIDAVRVLTIHKAKGLEFPVVFMPGFEERRSPHGNETFIDERLYDVDKYSGDEEDQRRVYYTAMTRSEKYLFITGSISREGMKKNYEPHRFLDEIDRKYFSEDLESPRPRSGLPLQARSVGAYPTSFSHLVCYSRCPQDFKLRNVYCYNAGIPVTFGYGTNIHNMLNVIHKKYIRAKKIPTEEEIEKTFDRIFKMRYATDKIAENMKKSALGVVKRYVNLNRDGFTRILETEKKFELVINEALISGQIDLLKKIDDKGQVTEVEIIDFKTDRNDSIYIGDYEKQLRFYAVACLKSLGLKPQKAYVHHLDKNSKTLVDISPPKLEKTISEVDGQVTDILQRRFPPKPVRETCTECDYKLLCPSKEFRAGVK